MTVISICLAVISIGIAAFLYVRSRTRRCNIPGPRGWPIAGPSLRQNVFKDFAKLSKQWGDIFCCRFGMADVVVMTKFEIVDELFRKRQGTCNDRFIKVPDHVDIPIGFGELQHGDKWKELRSFTMGVLNNKNLGDRTFEDLLNDEASLFYNHVKKTYGSKAFFPKKLLLHCMGNIILNLAFRKRVEYTDGDQMQGLLDAAHTLPQCLHPFIFFAVPSIVQILARFNILPIKKLRESQLAMYKITDVCKVEISKHERGKVIEESEARDMVDLFLSAVESRKNERKKTFLTENSLKGVATNVFAAGLDSTATMLLWFVLLLTKHEHVQSRLREEVHSVIGTGRLPKLSDRESMQYVHAVIQETHRFVSVAPMAMYHMAKEDVEYDGYFLPKNTYLISNLWGMHHDERVFPEPEEYKPERFISDSGEFVKSKYVTAFGIGKRSCPGEVLAQRQLFLFVTQLVQRFKLKPAEGSDAESISTEGVYDGAGYFPPEFQTRFIPIE